MDEITVRLETTKAEMKEEEEAAAKGTGELTIESVEAVTEAPDRPLDEARFIEPVSLILISTVAFIAKRMVSHWLKNRQRGVQIDLRKDPPVISRISGVPAGFLVVIDKDGKADVHQGSYERGEDLEPLLSRILAPA